MELGTPDLFFDAVDADVAEAGDRVPEWHGELYFEMHRGTFTTQANTKLGNRTCERLLREAELWWSLAELQSPELQSTGAGYPYDTLDAAWKETLFQQFHDIIPGSSIVWVYEDTAETYGRLVPLLDALVEEALTRLADGTAGHRGPRRRHPRTRRGRHQRGVAAGRRGHQRLVGGRARAESW